MSYTQKANKTSFNQNFNQTFERTFVENRENKEHNSRISLALLLHNTIRL